MQVAGQRRRLKTPLDTRRLQPELQPACGVGRSLWCRLDAAASQVPKQVGLVGFGVKVNSISRIVNWTRQLERLFRCSQYSRVTRDELDLGEGRKCGALEPVGPVGLDACSKCCSLIWLVDVQLANLRGLVLTCDAKNIAAWFAIRGLSGVSRNRLIGGPAPPRGMLGP